MTSQLNTFEWRYLSDWSSDPLNVWFYGAVFRISGNNGAIFGLIKSKMTAGRHISSMML